MQGHTVNVLCKSCLVLNDYYNNCQPPKKLYCQVTCILMILSKNLQNVNYFILNHSLFLFLKQHEEASVQMFDYMLEVNNLSPSFIQYNLTERDVIFIKELIAGTALDTNGSQVNSFGECPKKMEGVADYCCLYHLPSCLLSVIFTTTSRAFRDYCSIVLTTSTETWEFHFLCVACLHQQVRLPWRRPVLLHLPICFLTT